MKLALLITVLLALVVKCLGVTLAWDRTPGTNVAGYRVYQGSASHIYTNSTIVGNVTNVTLTSPPYGKTNYYVVTAFDNQGLESDYSNEVSYTVLYPVVDVAVRVWTGTNLNGPWAILTNVLLLSVTNPNSTRFYRPEAVITSTRR